VNNDNAIIKSHSILVKQSPEEYTDVNSSPNDSLEASHYARHAQHFPNTTPDYTDEIHLGQSHMISPINNITQEDVPLPTIPPIDADRFHKLTTEFGQNSVEIDVATPLSVLDLSPLDSDGGIPASKTNQRNVIDTTSSKQVNKYRIFSECHESSKKLGIKIQFFARFAALYFSLPILGVRISASLISSYSGPSHRFTLDVISVRSSFMAIC
jgi:hypothetical protein